jgi:hypothetical protein
MDADKDSSSDDVKTLLMNKYREIFINKLSRQDLDELRFSILNQYDQNLGWNREYKLKFESKLRHYFHEEILRREIVSIEALIRLMNPEDLTH